MKLSNCTDDMYPVKLKIYKYLSLGLIRTASFLASKLYHATERSPDAKLIYLNCLLLGGEFKRANSFYSTQSENISSLKKLDRIFFLRSILSHQDTKQQLNGDKDSLLESFFSRKLEDHENFDSRKSNEQSLPISLDSSFVLLEENSREVEAAYCYLQGKAALQLVRKKEATELLKEALQYDCFCIDAIATLSESDLLTETEKRELVLNSKLLEDESWLQLFYSGLLKCSLSSFYEIASLRLNSLTNETVPKRFYLSVESMQNVLASCHSHYFCEDNLKRLSSDTDFLITICGFLYSQKRFSHCDQVLDKVLTQDKYCSSVYTWKAACLYALGKVHELFRFAHWLVREFPQSECSWYAVGCYYLSCNQYFQARQYFQKATSLRPSWSLSWIALGHAFAFQDESDQALASYRTVYRLSSLSFDSVLFMAIEYLRQNNFSQAQRLLEQASSIAPSEPQPFHEMGVLHYRQENFASAIDNFQRSLQLTKQMIGDIPSAYPELSGYFSMLTASLLGLGHCYRRQGLYSKALDTLEDALTIAPQDPYICSAIETFWWNHYWNLA
ncbi:anaphase-promoting complex subunit 6 [Galdieria sulphuraria]|uniref:Anaphase-promoting complex subunit 6 n=1 Tax=Galdieria sulphuraria TaxID=130081 RepID=M2XXN8_GALSU|nr:anaphase-promoting complex subunit 6 [Galdieria sulphuraria]EME28373.1 anaphase-promoting complex subunit 6 [Galdieria sulphuraria]|eukprot:XP_005704893.1 anaphase-promoting complex subunit 6 [Galdieria sulphuraria]